MFIENAETFRENIRTKIIDILPCGCDFLDLVAKNIEIGVFNYAIKKAKEFTVVRKWSNNVFVNIYITRLRTIFYNLQHSLFLREYLFSEPALATEKARQMAFMKHEDMNPQIWKEMIMEKQHREMQKFETTITASTTTFTCKRCKSTNCTYEAVQTRSADEAMTIFVSCLDCGNSFKTC